MIEAFRPAQRKLRIFNGRASDIQTRHRAEDLTQNYETNAGYPASFEVRRSFFKIRKTLIAAAVLMLFAYPSCAAEISDVFMRVAVSGNTVNMRTAADPKAESVAKASAHMEFIAERLPFTSDSDGSEWYRVLFAFPQRTADSGGRKGTGVRPVSIRGTSLNRVVSATDSGDVHPLYISTRFVRERPLAKGDDEAISGTGWRRGIEAARADAFTRSSSGWREFSSAVRAFVGLDMSDALLRWSHGRPADFGRNSEIYRISERSGGDIAESEIFIIGGIMGTFRDGALVNASIIRRGAEVCGAVIGISTEADITSMLGKPSAERQRIEADFVRADGIEFSFYTPNSIGAERVIASCARAVRYGDGNESLTFGFDGSGVLNMIRVEKK